MDENRFFKWIWRLNSLIILLLVSYGTFSVVSELIRNMSLKRSKEPVITSVAEDPKGKEKWVLGYSKHINGSEYILLPLVSENREEEIKGGIYVASAYRGVIRDPAKNILFINSTSNESYWLFNDTNRLILNIEEFPFSDRYEASDVKTKVLFYKVITIDTNGDRKLSYEDKQSLALSSPEGKGYQILLDEFDRIVCKSMVNDDKVLIIFQKAGVGYSMLFRLDPFEVLVKNEIPKIENS